MYEIDPERHDLAREFKACIYGRHSGELQRVLNRMRGGINAGRYVIICTGHREWVLARMGQRRAIRSAGPRAQSIRASGWSAALARADRARAADRERTVTCIVGYADRMSVRPGDTPGHGQLQDRRQLPPSSKPDLVTTAEGAGHKEQPVSIRQQRLSGRLQRINAGSYVLVPAGLLLQS
jgi:hypothetical protein